MTNITFIGLGAMGQRMATRLLDAGYQLTVYNRSEGPRIALGAQGAKVAGTPREAVAGADLVITMLTDDDASMSVWMDQEKGVLSGIDAGTVALTSSTLSPAYVQVLAGALKQKGVALLDAPVVGTRPHAEAGQLTYLVGGDATVLASVKPVLLAMGAHIHHVGDTGMGMAMKLVVNGLFANQVAALGEALTLLEGVGISQEAAVALLNGLPITSPVAQRVGQLMLAGGFSPNFPIDLVAKDVRYYTEMGTAAGMHTPLLSGVQKVFEAAAREGLGGSDISGVIQYFASNRLL
ncbi:MAG: NAD(P)-dependent oxidoreductase [Bacteroidota bacterium]